MRRSAIVVIAATAVSLGCGKKGPPLPPLLRLPAAPAEITAARRGDEVIVQFNVPGANTDATRPANVSRVDVYGFTGSTRVSDDQLVKLGTKVGSVAVKSPRDPDQTVEPDESAADIEPPAGEGLEQGSRAKVDERLTAAALVPIATAPPGTRGRAPAAEVEGPLLGLMPNAVTSRTYVGVSIDKRGRQGPLSTRVTVPMAPAPPAPAAPLVAFDESSITVTWTGSAESGTASFLPSHPLGMAVPAIGYHVYEAPSGAPETRLTNTPVSETKYIDSRITWGATRCYAVRAIEMMEALSLESEERPATCVTLADTFPPAAPKGLSGVASESAISLIWEPNSEKDLGGYLVLRGLAPDGTLEPITPAPIQATIFNDRVPAGVRYVYAISAVDKAGNRSASSTRFEEAGR